MKKGTYKDISGMRSGLLVVVDIANAASTGKETTWNCVCDCGNMVEVKSSKITTGAKTHCGCKPRVDLLGKVFSFLTVKSYEGAGKWSCECVCGNTTSVVTSELNNGHTKSCGCYRDNFRVTHGMHDTRQYKAYRNMIKRCDYDKDELTYALYGGRGISYDGKWKTFEGFWEDMEDGYSDELTLDRIDCNGNYCKENCRWVDSSTQSYNQRISSINTSGRTGVSYYTSRDQWEAYISVEKKFIKLGYFNTFEGAVKAREKAEIKYYGYIKE